MTFREMTNEQLGAAISGIAEDLAWPTTPDVAGEVGTTLRLHQKAPSLVAPRLRLPSRRRTVLVIAATLLALAGAAFAARLVIELGAATVYVLPGAPTALPTDVVSPDDLGREVTLAEAATIAGFEPALPRELGDPISMWVDEAALELDPDAPALRVVSIWSPSPHLPQIPETGVGALLMQFEGDEEVAFKQVYGETNRFGTAVVEGREAFWTSGEHLLVLVSGDRSLRLLVTGNVLMWQDAEFTFRLETSLPKDRAVAIAESMNPAFDPA